MPKRYIIKEKNIDTGEVSETYLVYDDQIKDNYILSLNPSRIKILDIKSE